MILINKIIYKKNKFWTKKGFIEDYLLKSNYKFFEKVNMEFLLLACSEPARLVLIISTDIKKIRNMYSLVFFIYIQNLLLQKQKRD